MHNSNIIITIKLECNLLFWEAVLFLGRSSHHLHVRFPTLFSKRSSTRGWEFVRGRPDCHADEEGLADGREDQNGRTFGWEPGWRRRRRSGRGDGGRQQRGRRRWRGTGGGRSQPPPPTPPPSAAASWYYRHVGQPRAAAAAAAAAARSPSLRVRGGARVGQDREPTQGAGEGAGYGVERGRNFGLDFCFQVKEGNRHSNRMCFLAIFICSPWLRSFGVMIIDSSKRARIRVLVITWLDPSLLGKEECFFLAGHDFTTFVYILFVVLELRTERNVAVVCVFRFLLNSGCVCF